MDDRPRIGITIGDPNGIGAEVVLKAVSLIEVRNACRVLIYGSREIIDEAERITGLGLDLELVEIPNFKGRHIKCGHVAALAGQASLSYIEKAVRSAIAKEIDAVVTAPISKESINMAGSKHPGHTEMLQELTGTDSAVMMFEGGNFRVVLVTIHCALSDVPALVTQERVFSTIQIAHSSLVNLFNVSKPKIAVCGLNPHAGESGVFGNEEILHIIPAVKEAKELGIDVTGPLPADTLFYYANRGEWDAVVAMYHDQGLIPFKMLSFDKGVNVTLGLPIIRTSPDHGTAFDIAWEGKADPSSMAAAIKLAAKLVRNKRRTPVSVFTDK